MEQNILIRPYKSKGASWKTNNIPNIRNTILKTIFFIDLIPPNNKIKLYV